MAKNSKEKQREYDSQRAGTRTRNWTAILYPEDLPDDFRARIDESHVRWIESPLHDRDVNADGQPKKIHIHILLMFDAVKNVAQVTDIFKTLFGESENGSIVGVAAPQRVSDRCAMVRYFAHLDNPSKAQYDVSEIVGHNGADPTEILRYNQAETLDMMRAIEEFIEDNNITELCDLSACIRNTHPEWYLIITTRNTVYFNGFIRSRRHKLQKLEQMIDPYTGEIKENEK